MSQSKFNELVSKYTDDIVYWSTEDLVELSCAIDAEIQDRAYRDSTHNAAQIQLGCQCPTCREFRGENPWA